MVLTDPGDGNPPILQLGTPAPVAGVLLIDPLQPRPGTFSSPLFRVIQADSVESALEKAESALELAAAVIADDLPSTPFPEAVRRLQTILPELPLVALTSDTEVANVVFLMRYGACDVVVRPVGDLAMLSAITRFHALRKPATALAAREQEVFALLGDGRATSEIAEILHLNAKTIDGALIRLRTKLHCVDTTVLRRLAVQRHRHAAVQAAVAITIPVTGHECMDGQHGDILAMLSRLELELDRPETPIETITATADALLAITHDHSATEITLMESSGFPGLDQHRDEHRSMLGKLEDMRLQLAQARPTSLASFRSFLVHWMGQHIPRCDRPLAEHLAAQRE